MAADPDKESAREARITRGRQAETVLTSDAFLQALDDITNALTAEFISTAAEKAEERERLWAIGQALDRVPRQLEAYMETGKVEERNKKLDAEQ